MQGIKKMAMSISMTLTLCHFILLTVFLQCVLGNVESTVSTQGQVTKMVVEQEQLFQEELRSAMNSHWEILQNIRYHTLISKMQVAQLDKKVKMLAKKIGNIDTTKTTQPTTITIEAKSNEEEQLRPIPPKPEQKLEENPKDNDSDNGMHALMTSLKELSLFYESLNYTAGAFERPLDLEDGVYEKLVRLLEQLKGLIEKDVLSDKGKRLIRKSTKNLNATLATLSTTETATTVMTSTTIASEDVNKENITVQIGKIASLKCRVSDQGTGTVVWTKANVYDGEDMLTVDQYVYSGDPRHMVTYKPDSKDWMLSIRDVRSNDEGRYRCEVNTVPSFSKNVYLIVKEEPKPVIMESYPSNVSALVGTTAKLHCKVSNLGSYTVAWRGTDHYGSSVLLTYGEDSYASDRRIGITYHQGSEDWTLNIQDIRQTDEGFYSCVVNSMPSISHSVALSVYDNQHVATELPPREMSVTVASGTSHSYACTPEDNLEDHQVFWTRQEDHQMFSADSLNQRRVMNRDLNRRIIVDSDSTQRIYVNRDSVSQTWSLHIEDVVKYDEGTYVCLVESSATRPILILHLSVDIQPYIIDDDGDNVVTADQGSTAFLHCRVGNLANYTVSWTRRTKNDTSYILTVHRSTFHWDPRLNVAYDAPSDNWRLKIRNVIPNDTGVYQCHVNTQPVLTHSVSLDVGSRTTISMSTDKRNFTVEVGEVAKFPCLVSDLGDASVAWVRSSDLQVLTAGVYTLSRDPRFNAHTPDNKTWYLQIGSVLPGDEGEYLCQLSTDPITTTKFWLTVRGDLDGNPSTPATVVATTTTTTTITTVAPYCFHPFVMIAGDLCVSLVSLLKMTWDDAMLYCRSIGGELAVDLHGHIKIFLDQQHGIDGANWTMWPFWVGAKEERAMNGERTWKWVNGMSLNAPTWASNQPRIYGRRKAPQGSCLTLDGYEGYAAVAQPCHYRRRFVCLRQRGHS